MDFLHYVALGDSVSIDLYPALAAGEADVAVALERVASAGRVAPLGAASLLYQNDESRWPEEAGHDLVSLYPGVTYANLAADGATIGDIFGEQLARLEPTSEPTLVTLTAGTMDLFSAFANRPKADLLDSIADDILEAYDFLVASVRTARPHSLVIVSTIYDPSDRGGRIPGVEGASGALPLRALDRLNAGIRAFAAGTPGVLLADLYTHFLGHGVAAPEGDRWYWRRSLLEPNEHGAAEIRRLWLDTLTGAGVAEDGQ